jgi:hypothetical protein
VTGIPRLDILISDGKITLLNVRHEVVEKCATCFDKWINPVQNKHVDAQVWKKIKNGQETKAVSHPHYLKFLDWTEKTNPEYVGR